MLEHTGFASIHEDHFPVGTLKEGFQAIKGKLTTATMPQIVVNIAGMSEKEAAHVIESICELSYDVADAFAKRKE